MKKISTEIDYKVDLKTIASQEVKKAFVQLEVETDEETIEFLEKCDKDFLSINELWKDVTATVLKQVLGYSKTDANAITNRGKMFVISAKQMLKLYPTFSCQNSLLDIGAGDGSITQRFAKYFRAITVTETSVPMRRKLLTRGFVVLSPEELSINESLKFDTVFCFNVLDRCSVPISLLKQMRALLRDTNSLLLLGIVLPWCPFVESNSTQLKPTQIFKEMNGFSCKDDASFEKSLEQLLCKCILPIGFKLLSWSKVPYLCKGDKYSPLYKLPDAVVLLKKC